MAQGGSKPIGEAGVVVHRFSAPPSIWRARSGVYRLAAALCCFLLEVRSRLVRYFCALLLCAGVSHGHMCVCCMLGVYASGQSVRLRRPLELTQPWHRVIVLACRPSEPRSSFRRSAKRPRTPLSRCGLASRKLQRNTTLQDFEAWLKWTLFDAALQLVVCHAAALATPPLQRQAVSISLLVLLLSDRPDATWSVEAHIHALPSV